MVTYPGDEKARPLAFASSPGADPLLFLIKTPEPDGLLSQKGQALTVGDPEGRGFNLEAAQGNDLLVVVTGSALAPIRSVLQLVTKDRASYGNVSVLYGVRDLETVCFEDDLGRYQDASIDVTLCVSGGAASHARFGTKEGRVQYHLPAEVSPGTVLLVCGQFPMMDEVTAQLRERGLDPALAQRNF